jgi:hypothetical protein
MFWATLAKIAVGVGIGFLVGNKDARDSIKTTAIETKSKLDDWNEKRKKAREEATKKEEE